MGRLWINPDWGSWSHTIAFSINKNKNPINLDWLKCILKKILIFLSLNHKAIG